MRKVAGGGGGGGVGKGGGVEWIGKAEIRKAESLGRRRRMHRDLCSDAVFHVDPRNEMSLHVVKSG